MAFYPGRIPVSDEAKLTPGKTTEGSTIVDRCDLLEADMWKPTEGKCPLCEGPMKKLAPPMDLGVSRAGYITGRTKEHIDLMNTRIPPTHERVTCLHDKLHSFVRPKEGYDGPLD